MAQVIDIQLVASDMSANTTVRTQNVTYIDHIRPANASEIAAFPTAVSAVIVRIIDQNSQRVRTLLTSTAVSALKTAIAA